jgi:hypothetical protein
MTTKQNNRNSELLEQIAEETSRTRRSTVYVNGNELLREIQWGGIKWFTISLFVAALAARWNWTGIAFIAVVSVLFVAKVIWLVQDFIVGYKEAVNPPEPKPMPAIKSRSFLAGSVSTNRSASRSRH